MSQDGIILDNQNFFIDEFENHSNGGVLKKYLVEVGHDKPESD
jgi:hypothetical protein